MVVEKAGKKEDFELPESQKYKLTLGIDREIVRRAKMQDINISFWTEQLLKIMTFNKKEITTPYEDVVQTHYIFLSEVKKLLEKYELEGVNIGGFYTYDYNQVVDRYRPGAHKLDKENIARFLQRGVVHKPMQIIENLLYQMTQSSKVNKEKIKEMNVALRILKMMSENGGNNGGKVTKT